VVLIAGAAGLLGLMVGIAVGSLSKPETVSNAEPEPGRTIYVTVAATPAATAAAPTTATKPPTTKPPPAAATFGDGTWLVGSDIPAGTYKAKVPENDLFSYPCYWARLRSTDGSFAAIIANGNEGGGAQVVVTIKSTDKAFKSDGCGTWTKVK
jgi:hypothetical protein